MRGGPATDGVLAGGSFHRPTPLEVDDVNTDIVQKEVFGPVATFEIFDTEAEAIARAKGLMPKLAAPALTLHARIRPDQGLGFGLPKLPAQTRLRGVSR